LPHSPTRYVCHNQGAHLYGFPSPDSDYDLRRAHVLPLDAVVGLEVRRISKFEVRSLAKPLLYVYRMLLTGIHLMRTGVVNANLAELNAEARLPTSPTSSPASRVARTPRIEDADVAFHQRGYERLRGELQSAHEASQLPEIPDDETRKAMNDLLNRIRLRSGNVSNADGG